MSGYIDTAVQVNITATTATLSVPGTTIPAIFGYHTHNTDLIRTYTDLAGMVADGFTTTEPLYYLATALCEQNPRPATFKVIRGTQAVAQTFTLTITDHTDGESIGMTLTDASGVAHACYHTASSESAAQVATAVALLIAALSGVASSTASSNVITTTLTTAGKIWYPSALQFATFADTTATCAPGTDLDAAILVDNSWYGLSGESMSATNIALMATWAETNKKVHFYTSADSANLSASSGVFHTLQSSARKRSVGLYSANPIDYGATGWMSPGLVAFPGSYNFAYKSISGDPVDSLTPTQITNIQGDNGNFNITMAGVNVAIDGRSAQGQFIDLQIGIDGLAADIQSSVGTLLVSLPKVPYTRAGMSMVGAEVRSALQRAVDGGFLTNEAGFEYQVSLPDLGLVAPADKTARVLKNVNFTCYAQGAINKVQINGTVSI